MGTKQLVLEMLERHRAQNVSGEKIADALKLSRNMVWRAVNELRQDGYSIEAVTNKGYRLNSESDILSVEGIKPYLSHSELAQNIQIFAELDSTNREAKAQAIENVAHGTVILANEQKNGRGRYERTFYSPRNTGLYMSMILRTNEMGFINPTAITAYAALCVCDAIQAVTALEPSIKWVNDIYLNGKKVCGILTEAISEFESNSIREIIVGIGINIRTEQCDFPEAIRKLAGSIDPDGQLRVSRNRIAAEIINRLLRSDWPTETDLFHQYKQRLFILGKKLNVTKGKESFCATALDIDAQGRLVVVNSNGETVTLSSAEISILE